MSNINSVTEVIDASGQKNLPNGNFLYLISATAAVTIQLQRGGSTEIFSNAIGGLQMKRVTKWDWAKFIGAPGTTLTYFFGIGNFREDDTVLQQQIATVAGTVSVQAAPAATLSASLVTAVGNTAAVTTAQNLLRKSITVGNPSSNTGSVFVQSVGAGAGKGYELQVGEKVVLQGTYAFDVRNDSGVGQTFTTYEES